MNDESAGGRFPWEGLTRSERNDESKATRRYSVEELSKDHLYGLGIEHWNPVSFGHPLRLLMIEGIADEEFEWLVVALVAHGVALGDPIAKVMVLDAVCAGVSELFQQ